MPVPVFVLVAGAAGSGKSTLALALAARLGLPLADIDVVTRPMVDAFRHDHPHLDEPTALAQVRTDRYRALAAHVRDARATDPTSGIIVAAPFTAELAASAVWSEWIQAAGWTANDTRTVVLVLDPAERYRRMASRGSSRDTVVLASGSSGLPASAEPVVPHLRVDAALPTTAQVDHLMSQFDNA